MLNVKSLADYTVVDRLEMLWLLIRVFLYPAVIELKWNKQHQRLLKALESIEGMRKIILFWRNIWRQLSV